MEAVDCGAAELFYNMLQVFPLFYSSHSNQWSWAKYASLSNAALFNSSTNILHLIVQCSTVYRQLYVVALKMPVLSTPLKTKVKQERNTKKLVIKPYQPNTDVTNHFFRAKYLSNYIKHTVDCGQDLKVSKNTKNIIFYFGIMCMKHCRLKLSFLI